MPLQIPWSSVAEDLAKRTTESRRRVTRLQQSVRWSPTWLRLDHSGSTLPHVTGAGAASPLMHLRCMGVTSLNAHGGNTGVWTAEG